MKYKICFVLAIILIAIQAVKIYQKGLVGNEDLAEGFVFAMLLAYLPLIEIIKPISLRLVRRISIAYIFIEILLFAILTYEIRAFIQNAYRATDIGQIALYFIVNLGALGMAWYRYVDAKAET